MDLLIIGGTRFVGRHIVDNALERGHTLTLFNRGKSNPGLFPEVEEIHGDRDGDLHLLEGNRWDAVIDTSGYIPRIVRASAETLAPSTEHYVFISTISVYRDPLSPNADEDAPLATTDDPDAQEVTGENYGALKVLCERAVEDVYGSRALIIRPGLVVGPHDPTDRFTYWPVRIARGGQVLAPGEPSTPVQFIDARDLAEWTVRQVEAQQHGTYNATGPAQLVTRERVLHACREITGSDAQFVWVDDAFLLEHDVTPFTEMPLWIPGEEAVAYGTVRIQRALNDGLTIRPLPQTIADTLRWASNRGEDHEWRGGLSPDREKRLLDAWHDTTSQTD